MYVPTVVNQYVEMYAKAYKARQMGLSISDGELGGLHTKNDDAANGWEVRPERLCGSWCIRTAASPSPSLKVSCA